ncbi:hypothetical protein CDV31_003373 [Fusarium ambrosium]|uniref:Uncharacterized protein n=1 Tax=Fusarium ambrosium TaxID=131363 RepID=A0A428UU21_9HYPO|nr:hypothetical protein CDV31_003373 [Fusarium ambrosium]
MRYENHASEFGSLDLYDAVKLLSENEKHSIHVVRLMCSDLFKMPCMYSPKLATAFRNTKHSLVVVN